MIRFESRSEKKLEDKYSLIKRFTTDRRISLIAYHKTAEL